MGKGAIIGITATAAIIAGGVAFRALIPPSLTFNDTTVIGGTSALKVSGSYNFGKQKGVKFSNSENSSYMQVGRGILNFGWTLRVQSGKDGVLFELWKNGKKIKMLKQFK